MKKKVQVWVFLGEKALLLKTTPQRGGFWQPVTGSVEEGESFEKAAIRELDEETGFKCSLLDSGYEFQYENQRGSFLERVFFGETKNPDVWLDPKEHQSFQWQDMKKVPEDLKFDSNRVAFNRILSIRNKNSA